VKTLFANSVAASHNKEFFCLIYAFHSPDGKVDTCPIILPPSGAKTTQNLLSEEIKEYEGKYGKLEPWSVANERNKGNNTPII